MKILITGATGFLGSHILRALVEKGYSVVIIKRKTSDCKRISGYIDMCSVYDTENLDYDVLFQKEQIDVILHCATFYDRDNSLFCQTIETNLLFPVRLLKTAQRFGCHYFINTDSFFTKQISHEHRDLQKLYMPDYTLSKYQFSQWGKLESREDKCTFINVKLEHLYGENDGDTKFIPNILKKCMQNEPHLKLTSGVQERDFVYVRDVVDAYLRILAEISEGSINGYHEFETGTGRPVSVAQMVNIIHNICHSTTRLDFGAVPTSEYEIMYSAADICHLQSLGWKPKFSIEKGIEAMRGAFTGEADYCNTNL